MIMTKATFNDFLDLVRWAESKGRSYWREQAPITSVINERSKGRLDLLFREGFLQIERVYHGPFEVVPMHRHPDVDSAELSIWGAGAFWIRRRRFALGEGITPWRRFFIPHTCWHGGISDASGGSFLSIQNWYAPIKSIKDNWESRDGQ
jgi:hypothetical protein